jgi:hypothetical protein
VVAPDPRCSCGHARRTHGWLTLVTVDDQLVMNKGHGACRSCACERFDRVATALPPPAPLPDMDAAATLAEHEATTRRVEQLRQVVALQREGQQHLLDASAAQSRAMAAQSKIIDLLLEDRDPAAWHPLENL